MLKFKKTLIIPSMMTLVTMIFAPDLSSRTLAEDQVLYSPLPKTALDVPQVAIAIHNINNIGMTVSNVGCFGTGLLKDRVSLLDETTGLPAPSGVYPYPGNLQYLFTGIFWIGAVVGRDTLVSVGGDGWLSKPDIHEFWPDPGPKGEIIHRSILNSDDADAVSEQDFIAVYTDTLTNPKFVDDDPTDSRPHEPLNIEVTERSYAWSYSYAEDFILFDYSIKNIGRRKLEDVYMGIYVDGDVEKIGSDEGPSDDICGFRQFISSPQGHGFIDTVNIAWIADNNGRDDDNQNCPATFELTSVTGVRVVRTPSDDLKYSFNWWVSNAIQDLDWGPQKVGSRCEIGTPMGDKNKYCIMRNQEFDYDQLTCALDHTSQGWLPPHSECSRIADGYDTRYLLSFGPFDIEPMDILPITFAYVAGENFHKDCSAFQDLFKSSYPYDYYETLNFEDLGTNAMWASWIYDNPGYDTDGNGTKGKYRIYAEDSTVRLDTIQIDPELVVETTMIYLKADTFYYEGDGVPDFRGASPPPSPPFRIVPRVDRFNCGELRIRWNGLLSETTEDIFSNTVDFEGYRVYLSLTPQASGFTLITSYDREDFRKFVWNNSRGLWEQNEPPFTLDALQAAYGAGFDPIAYPLEHPFYWRDSLYYFSCQDWNQCNYRDSNLIHKVFPDEPPPTTLDIDSAGIYYPNELTDERTFKYYEYEYTLKNLLPSRLYYVAVTAFDYGSPKSGLSALETNPVRYAIAEYPQNQTGLVESERLNVVVYPNPYRADGRYRDYGFEGMGLEQLSDDRVRAVHFTNLPAKCTIRIFTIDGDLVREIVHDCPPDSPQSMHDKWEIITRNTQAPVSGIYYYSVESAYGNQIGKIVLIM
jgi:hypothetical protein